MAIVLKDKKLKQSQYYNLARDMHLDLIAFFSLLKEDILKKLDEDKSPDEVIHEITKILS